MDETLLSRSFLESMGYNLNDNFERVHILLNNNHVNEIDPTQIKAVSFKYQSFMLKRMMIPWIYLKWSQLELV